MSKVCSSHNLAALEIINNQLERDCVAFKVLFDVYHEKQYLERRYSLDSLIASRLEDLQNCCLNLIKWEQALRSMTDFEFTDETQFYPTIDEIFVEPFQCVNDILADSDTEPSSDSDTEPSFDLDTEPSSDSDIEPSSDSDT